MNYLSSKIFSALESPALIDTKKPSESLNPSSASLEIIDRFGDRRVVGSCLRQQYYRARSYPIPFKTNPDWELSSLIGNKLHELIFDILVSHGFKMGLQIVREEHSIYSTISSISGRSDLLAWDYNSNELVGIEIKSVGEYKAGKVIESPAEEHVLQAMLYLDHYRKAIPEGMKRPTKWYILYISRTENWTIKGKKHGSQMAMVWDSYLTLDADGVPTIYSSSGIEKWSDFKVDKIYDRFNTLKQCLVTNTVPDRDFDIKYSEEKIAGLYKRGKITKKTDTKVIEKWLSKGGTPGTLKLDIGDFECQLCEFRNSCWDIKGGPERNIYNLPELDSDKITPPSTIDEMF